MAAARRLHPPRPSQTHSQQDIVIADFDAAIMSGFLRGKQTGMQKDLSANIASTDFCPDDLARYGINSQIR